MASVNGKLSVIGLGPGDADQLTAQASAALRAADVLLGYARYLDRVPEQPGQRREPSDNRHEIERAQRALTQAAAGTSVALVSGGDPGVFAMGAAVCEALDHGPRAWRNLELVIIPGVTSMLALAARVGAPLGHDFCAVSLSDNLKPWSVIERRLQAAAGAGFVIALYNPVSRARPWQLQRALEILRNELAADTAVIFGRAVGRADERIQLTTLNEAGHCEADMATCILIGSAETRIVQRPDRTALIYTPRSMRSVST